MPWFLKRLKCEAEHHFSDLYTSKKSVTQRWKCAVARWLLLSDRCQLEMYRSAPWTGLWRISELWVTCAPASDPAMKYVRAGLCWRRWSLLWLQRDLLVLARQECEAASMWQLPPTLTQHSVSDGVMNSVPRPIFSSYLFFYLTLSLPLIWMLSSVFLAPS